MTDVDTALPEAVSRALPLLREPPERPDAHSGYLDLLGGDDTGASGWIQRLWASGPGSAGYDQLIRFARKFPTIARPPRRTWDVPQGATVLDVCCGPGEITAALGGAVGPGGLALGVDVSAPMLRRAVGTEARPHVGFLRANALDLPFRDGRFDAATCMAGLQLIPNPETVLDEMSRVLVPGGVLTVMAPTVRGPGTGMLAGVVGTVGQVRTFTQEEIPDHLESHGFDRIHSTQTGPVQWTTARKGA